MPTWWGRPSSKEVKRKENKDCFNNTIQRKLKSDSEEKHNDKSRGSRRHRCDTISEKGSISHVPSRSPSPPTHVFCCQIAERPHAQPLPLPGLHLPSANHSNSGINITPKLESTTGSKPSLDFPLPKPGYVSNREQPTDAEGAVATASVCSDSSTDSEDQSNSHVLSPLASDCENGNRTAMHSSFSVVHKDQSPITIQKSLRALSKPAPQLCNNQLLNNSSKRTSVHLQNIQIARSDGLWSAPDSSMSSPSRSPMRTFAPEQVLNSEFCTAKPYQDIASGHCSSPGVGNNSGHYLVGGDPSGQIFWPLSRCSPEYSPIPSCGMRSPGLSSRIHGNAVAPLHPRAGVAATESPTKCPDGAKQQTHRLPLPPITITNASPFSPTYSGMATPSTPHSPVSSENLTSPGSSWKKGQFLGRGTFGQVYLGFNSDSGEMCAMKEVTLFSDDPKSRESAKQLGQEVALLSGLRHPNIVQYYGSEMVDDKIYIYLEYVSGGSIYKLLQQYGQFGEIAIRNYTRQILSGLAYLHAKNTVHRDIKGANILVDPNGVVKLADFGMAKHISGPSCSLSFKGSPYWMAPEVINNSNGYNFSVDIWSLGCTVLEMATTKPPWSQYEGVAAMFKIGNSKELPEIPDNLSGDGKDFVRLCLQRNPLHRPSATQLLFHPFVNNATLDPSETTPAVRNALRSPAIGPAKLNLCMDSEAAAVYLLRSLRSSDAYTPKIISCPVSPTSRSPLLPSRSLHVSGRTSPCPISSPHTASGSSTPLTGGTGAIPFPQTKQPTSAYEGLGLIQRPQKGLHSNRNAAYKEPFWRIQQPSYDIRDTSRLNYGNHNRKAMQGDPKNIYDGKSYLADCLSHLSTADKGSREAKFHS